MRPIVSRATTHESPIARAAKHATSSRTEDHRTIAERTVVLVSHPRALPVSGAVT